MRATTSPRHPHAIEEPPWLRRLLLAVTFTFLVGFLIVPLGAVFVLAFREGVAPYIDAIARPDTLAAVKLTLLVAALALPANLVFGLAAAWCLAKFRFPGKGLLLALVDLPFSVSPVVAGLVLVLLFGRRGFFGTFLDAHGVRIIFAVPGIVLATVFVTLPFIAREVLPLLEAQGNDAEEAAYTLGSGPWRTFFRVTLPKVKWGVIYGVILANARAMGEFGAVSVVSGHIRGLTNTLPLQAEILYNEYDFIGAFAVASLLTVLALVTLVAKKIVEHRAARTEQDG